MQINDQIYYSLGILGYTGTLDDRIYKHLGDLGYLGAMNDRLRRFFFSLGYVGSFTDQYAQWRNDGYTLFEPNLLFLNGEVGTWFDPSDINLNWRRNLFTYTEQFDNAAWTKNNVTVTANSVVSPDGSLTGDTIVSTASTDNFLGQFRAAAGNASGVNWTFSFWARSSSGTVLLPVLGDDNTGKFWSNPNANKVTVTTSWQRFTISGTAPAASSTTVRAGFGGYAAWATGDTIYIWGAQLEIGSTPSDYQRIVTPEISYLDVQPLPILYQDAAGTTPVTAIEQPVSLMLDKSKGSGAIGSNTVVNGTFAADSDWTKGTDWTIGSGVATKTAGTEAVLSQAVTLTAGKYYIVTYTITRTQGTLTVQFTGGTTVSGTARVVAGTYTDILTAVSGNTTLEFNAGAGFAGTVDNVTLREMPAGNHAYTPSTASTARPTLSARYNLLTYSEQFDNAAWSKFVGSGTSITANSIVAPDGNTTADTMTRANTVVTESGVRFTTTQSNSTIYTLSVYAKVGTTGNLLYLRNLAIDNTTTTGIVKFDLTNGTVDLTLGATYTGKASITLDKNGYYRCSITGTTASSIANNLIDIGLTSSGTVGGTAGDFLYIWGADLRVSNDGVGIPSYQRIAAATDYDTVNFPPYLRFDGSNDYMLTNSIDFSGTDKMTVFAGVRKESDAATGLIVENFNNSTYRNFTLRSPGAVGANYDAVITYASGAFEAGTATTYTSPISSVLSAQYNTTQSSSATRVKLNINGTAQTLSFTTAGSATSGTFSNTPLYIGRRLGATFSFNGRLYSLIIRGVQSTTSEITNTEQWVNQRTRAY
jgi:hypothetical protein